MKHAMAMPKRIEAKYRLPNVAARDHLLPKFLRGNVLRVFSLHDLP